MDEFLCFFWFFEQDMILTDCVLRMYIKGARWSSLAAHRAHNPKVAGSNPALATIYLEGRPLPIFCLEMAKRAWQVL